VKISLGVEEKKNTKEEIDCVAAYIFGF